MLPKHHNLKEPFRNDGKNVRLGLSDNRKQVSGSKKRLMVPFICSDFEQIVQKKRMKLSPPTPPDDLFYPYMHKPK